MPSDHPRRPPPREADTDDKPTDTLWVGNISSDAVGRDLTDLFKGYGALDCTAMRASRPYAFVHFRHTDDARAAKDALQGTPIHGSPIKIEFARPAKPCKNLWIGGISSSTTKEQLVVDFLKFGKIEEYIFLRDRNSALIDYYKIDDAIAAQKNMNGKRLAGEQIRVDFLRPQPLRRDWPDHHDSRDGHFRSAGPPEPWGTKRHQLYGGRRDGPPSNVLWIGYPPSVPMDEQMLHNAMILFGEIERIKCFPSRHYSFVEFRSTDEARRAKEGLQGRLFNDPRIQILFSSSELAPHKDNPPPFPELGGPRPDMFFNDNPFGALEFFGPGRPMAPNNFSGLLPLPGPNMLTRPFPPQGIDPHHGGAELYEFGGAMHNFPDGDLNNPMPPNWRRRSPSVPGMLPSAPGVRPPFRSIPGGWDGFDIREPKRSRIDGSPADNAHFHARRMDSEISGEPFGFPHPDRGTLVQSQHNRAVRGHNQVHGSSDHDHCWRGIIAKGGTHVCHARCVPLGKGIDSLLPEIINCSARTGLDMLTKHYAEASGFDIVFFLPDSEEDFAAYTEFLRYLGQKDRAGVAKLDDGTTLFLVPPSDFLSKILNVSGPERLYGVVLKLPQQSSGSATQPQLALPPPPSHYVDRQQVPDLHIAPQNEDHTYNRPLHEGSMPWVGVENSLSTHIVEPYASQPSSQDYVSKPAVTSQGEVSLTPELLATLASLIPGNLQPGATGTIQMPLNSSVRSASSAAAVMHDGSVPLQGWRQEQQVTVPGVSLEQPSHPLQQLGYQYNTQAPIISQFPAYANIPNGPEYTALSTLASTQIQEPSLNASQAIPTKQSNNYIAPSQGGQFSVHQSNQQYQLDPSFASHNNYGMLQTADAAGAYAPFAQQLKPNPSAAPVQIESLSQPPQIAISLPADQVNSGFPTQGQQLQAALSGLGQGTSEGDADKNQRYQSTLQFAANLLLQLQQQQQASGQAAQGSANQQ